MFLNTALILEERSVSVSPLKSIFMGLALAGLLAGCAKPPPQQAVLTTQSVTAAQVAAVLDQPLPPELTTREAADPVLVASLDNTDLLRAGFGGSRLAGRTLKIGSIDDLSQLRDGEVILTFDDGPNPSQTPKILATLDEYGVKAVFFMVGKMAAAHPKTAQIVARMGHTIGSHTHGHENLKSLSEEVALVALSKGEDEISAAIAPTGKTLAPFFRFPYLAQTRALRADVTDAGHVIFDVDIDSLDYLDQSPEKIIKRTMKRLDARGKGIILFHDIHARTATLLPDFLEKLQESGYKVVKVVPKSNTLFDFRALIAAR